MLVRFIMQAILCMGIFGSVSQCSESSFKDDLMQNSRTAFLGAFGMGIATSVARILDPVLNGAWRKMSLMFSFLNACVQRGFNRWCRRPNALESRTVRQWHDLLEQLVYGICEVSKSGKLIMQMSHNVQKTELKDGCSDWQFYVETVNRIVNHMIDDIAHALPHYKGCLQERQLCGFLVRSIALKDYKVIAFVLEELMIELHNIKTLCNNAQSADEINTDELNRIARVALLLLKNLHTTIRDDDDEDVSHKSLGVGSVGGVRTHGFFS